MTVRRVDDWTWAWGDARVTYWAPPGESRPALVDEIVDDAEGHAAAVLAESLAELGIDEIDYQSFAPAVAAVEACGFQRIATQIRLVHDGGIVVPPAPAGFSARPADEASLLHLIDAVRVGSLDRGTRDHDARAELDVLGRLERIAWEIAVDESGRDAGFVLPIRIESGPVIAFIGVAPSARGRGVGRWLLARGTHACGGRVFADVDEDNPAMLRAAAAVGYRPVATRAHYRRPPTGARHRGTGAVHRGT